MNSIPPPPTDSNNREKDIALIINTIVILFVGAALLAVFNGKAGADELLFVSILSGAMTLFSYNLSRKALARLNESENMAQSDEHK